MSPVVALQRNSTLATRITQKLQLIAGVSSSGAPCDGLIFGEPSLHKGSFRINKKDVAL